jgi:D-alanyl-D-alanine carboxypeptidase
VRARYAILVDPATGAVLWGRRSRTPAPPASLTKMLAEAAGGSVPRFARAMDAESRAMGLHGSAWRNPNGLDAPGHRSTAFDLAILARRA